MSGKYPEITFKDVYPILKVMLDVKKEPSSIDSLPYDESVKSAFRELLLEKNESSFSDKSLKDMDLEQETIRLYESMKSIEVGESLDAKEKISLIKLQASSLKDLLDMMKDSKQIKNIRWFEDTIFQILTPEQREKVKHIIE